MSELDRGAIPLLLKRLDQLNAEGVFVVDRAALAMIAAVDGQTTIADIERVHGTHYTEDGFSKLLALGAIRLADPLGSAALSVTARTSTDIRDQKVSRSVTNGVASPRRPRHGTTHAKRRQTRSSSRTSTPGAASGTVRRQRVRRSPRWRARLGAYALPAAFIVGVSVLACLSLASWSVSWRSGRSEAAADINPAPLEVTDCDPGAGCSATEAAALSADLTSSRAPESVAEMAPATDPPAEATPFIGVTPTMVSAIPPPPIEESAATIPIATPPVPTVPTNVPSAADSTRSAASAVAQARSTTPPTPLAAHIDERFTDNLRGWPNDPRSTAWIADGGYRLFAREPGKFVAIGVPTVPRLQDVSMTATFRKVGGPPGGGYGLIVRDQADGPRDGTSQAGRYYVFEVGDRGEIGIWRREGAQWIDLLPWTPASAVHMADATNELKVQAIGDRLLFMVNGVIVAKQVDTALGSGTAGIFVGGDGNQVLLERLEVEGPLYSGLGEP